MREKNPLLPNVESILLILLLGYTCEILPYLSSTLLTLFSKNSFSESGYFVVNLGIDTLP